MNMLRTIGLIVLGVLVGCSGSPTAMEDVEKQAFDDMRSGVRGIIDDPEREAAVVALVDDMEAQYVEMRETAQRRRAALQELNADYDATREQFAEYLDTHNADLKRTQQEFLAGHRRLINATTAEEWSALEKSNTKSMQRLAESLASI
jgi:hypothetical protein